MTRRFELDWLRVLLFALLVPHHVAVGFVDWGADIYRFVNDRLAGDGMTLFIYWSHSWRLPSLFLIAGIGTWFLVTRDGHGPAFVGRRLIRLVVPLLFGTAFINVFGGYAMARVTGEADALAAFWWNWLSDPELRQVQHLWFLLNLVIYTLICWPIMSFGDRIGAIVPPPPMLFGGLTILSAGVVILAKPHAAALTGDNYQFPFYLLFFAGGFLVGADHDRVLDWARRRAWWLLAVAILLFLSKTTLLATALIENIESGRALASGGWIPAGFDPPNSTAFSAIEAATAWAWCIAALGLASRFLARPSPILSELTRGVFPFYVLHFPLTLIGLAVATRFAAPWWVEFWLLLVFVYAGTWVLWRAADRLGPVSVVVGGRSRGKKTPT